MGLEWSSFEGEHDSPCCGSEDSGDCAFVVSTSNSQPLPPLEFSPESSFAVCTGVGRQLNYCFKDSHLGYEVNNDARQFSNIFHNCLGLPSNNVKLLISGFDYPPTRFNIITDLRQAAEKVGKDGILFFTFSGHGMSSASGCALLPADGVRELPSLLQAEDFEEALSQTKAKYTVIILDCCHAGSLAHNIMVPSWSSDTRRFILPACSSLEKSYSYGALENGLFSFFLSHHLIHLTSNDKPGKFPVYELVAHTNEVCLAMISLRVRTLQQQVKNHSPSPYVTMTPQLYSEKHPAFMRSISGLDGQEEPDGIADKGPQLENSNSPYQRSYAESFLSSESCGSRGNIFQKMNIPLLQWLDDRAIPALITLHCHGYLQVSFPQWEMVFETVLTIMTRSAVAILDRSKVQVEEPDEFLKAFICIASAINTAFDQALEKATEEGKLASKLEIKLGHVWTCLRRHKHAVEDLYNLSRNSNDSRLSKLDALAFQMKSRVLSRQKSVGGDDDCTDGETPSIPGLHLLEEDDGIAPALIVHPTLKD